MKEKPTPAPPQPEKKQVKSNQSVPQDIASKQWDMPRHLDSPIKYQWSHTMDGVTDIGGVYVMNFVPVRIEEKNSKGQTVYRDVRMSHYEYAQYTKQKKQEQKQDTAEKTVAETAITKTTEKGVAGKTVHEADPAKTGSTVAPEVKKESGTDGKVTQTDNKVNSGAKSATTGATTSHTRPQGALKLAPAATKAGASANTGVVVQKQAAKTGAGVNPANALGGLKQTPASELGVAFNQVEDTSLKSLSLQKQEALNSIPHVDEAGGSAHNFSQKQNHDKIKATGKTAEAKNKFAGIGGFKPPLMHDVKLPVAPLHFIAPLVTEAGKNDVNPDQAQNQLHSLHLGAAEIPTDMGVAPALDLHGEADINNVHEEQHEQALEVNAAKNDAAQELHNDFGENSVIKDPGANTLATSHVMKPVVFNAKAITAQPQLDADTAAKLDVNMASTIHDKIGAQEEKNEFKKAEYDSKSEAERTKADAQISGEKNKSKQEQVNEQSLAQKQVSEHRLEWKNELDKTEKDFNVKAEGAGKEHTVKINAEKAKGETEAQKHIDEGNQKAAEKKTEANAKAEAEKKNSAGESKGFFGWLADKASALINKLKEGLNFIFEQLRTAVKWIFEQAKKLALAALELARQAVVGLIKAFGTVLKAFVSVAFAAFPAIRARINAKIDAAVNKAVQLANKAFDFFKKAVTAIIDVLAKVADTLLSAYQAFYNFLLDALDFVVAGIIKIMQGISNLVKAAMESPDHFWSQVSLELLGQDITKPLANEVGYDKSKDESQVGNGVEIAKHLGFGDEDDSKTEKGLLQADTLKEGEVISDEVATNFKLDPQLQKQLLAQGDGEVEFGKTPANDNVLNEERKEAADNSVAQNTMAAPQTATMQPNAEGKVGPFKDAGERGAFVWKQMKDGISKWWDKNKVKVIAGLIAGLLGGAILEVVTGGAITAAIPVIMDIMAVLFGLSDLADAITFIGQYITKSWIGQIAMGAMSLARSFVKLVIALVFDLIGGGEMIKGAKNTIKTAEKEGAKGVLKLATNTAKQTVVKQIKNVKEFTKIATEGGRAALKNGKLVLSGIKNGLKDGAKTLEEISGGLLKRFRFKKFKLIVKGFKFYLYGEMNPWVLLADGNLQEVSKSDIITKGRKTIGSEVEFLKDGKKMTGKVITMGENLPKNAYIRIFEVYTGKSAKGNVIHHIIEQQTENAAKGLTKEFINAGYQLRDIPQGVVNEVLHLSNLRKMWDSMYQSLNRIEKTGKLITNDQRIKALSQFAAYTDNFISDIKATALSIGPNIAKDKLLEKTEIWISKNPVDQAIQNSLQDILK